MFSLSPQAKDIVVYLYIYSFGRFFSNEYYLLYPNKEARGSEKSILSSWVPEIIRCPFEGVHKNETPFAVALDQSIFCIFK
jgi:hypothetical protein